MGPKSKNIKGTFLKAKIQPNSKNFLLDLATINKFGKLAYKYTIIKNEYNF